MLKLQNVQFDTCERSQYSVENSFMIEPLMHLQGLKDFYFQSICTYHEKFHKNILKMEMIFARS